MALAIDSDISKAKTLSKNFYLDENLFEKSKEKIFTPAFQFLGDSGLLGKGKNVFPFTLLENYLDEPLVLTRDKEDHISCLSNVCTHRGNIIATESCQSANLRCKYHGRLFKLDGKFQSMPEFKEVKNFPAKNDDLTKLPVHQWGKLMFVSLAKNAKPEMYFSVLRQRMNWYDTNQLIFRPDLSRDYKVNAHWALYCENFLEGFHIPFVHAGLNELIDYGSYETEIHGNCILQVGYSKEGTDCFELPESSGDFGRKISAYYFFIFPNMMFNFYPWGLSVNIIKPVSINKSTISFLTYVADESRLKKGAGADLHTVEMEDEEVVQNVQTGIRSRFYKHGRFSVSREKGVHHFQTLVAKSMSTGSK